MHSSSALAGALKEVPVWAQAKCRGPKSPPVRTLDAFAVVRVHLLPLRTSWHGLWSTRCSYGSRIRRSLELALRNLHSGSTTLTIRPKKKRLELKLVDNVDCVLRPPPGLGGDARVHVYAYWSFPLLPDATYPCECISMSAACPHPETISWLECSHSAALWTEGRTSEIFNWLGSEAAWPLSMPPALA